MAVDFIQIIRENTGAIVTPEASCHPLTLRAEKGDLLRIASVLHHDQSTLFDQLTCVTGVDNGPAQQTMEVIYHLYSIPLNHSVGLKVILPREGAEVESLTALWRSANWMEREVFDMFGVTFLHHPDLRRILMPADWEGHPLRKDYQHQERYRDVTVKY